MSGKVEEIKERLRNLWAEFQAVSDEAKLLSQDEQRELESASASFMRELYADMDSGMDGARFSSASTRYRLDLLFCNAVNVTVSYEKQGLQEMLRAYRDAGEVADALGEGLWYLPAGGDKTKEGMTAENRVVQMVVLPEGVAPEEFRRWPMDEQAQYWISARAAAWREANAEIDTWPDFFRESEERAPKMARAFEMSLPDAVLSFLDKLIFAVASSAGEGDEDLAKIEKPHRVN